MTSHQIATWTVPVSVFCVATLVALLVRQIVLRRLRHWTWLEAVRGPSMLWCVATGLALAIHNADAPPAFDFWAQKLIGTVIITSIGLATSSIAFRLVTVYAERNKLRIAGLSQTLINLFSLELGDSRKRLLRFYKASFVAKVSGGVLRLKHSRALFGTVFLRVEGTASLLPRCTLEMKSKLVPQVEDIAEPALWSVPTDEPNHLLATTHGIEGRCRKPETSLFQFF